MTGVEISSPEVQYWRQIQLPPNYLTENWPISNLACGGDGTYVAVAGRRGICHYNVITNKWKLFNNVQEVKILFFSLSLLFFFFLLLRRDFLGAGIQMQRRHGLDRRGPSGRMPG